MVVGGGEPDVDYTYTAVTIDGNQKNLRLTSVEYPSDRDVYYNYFNDSDDDDEAIHNRLNRIRNIASAATLTNGTPLSDDYKFVQYEYAGSGMVVQVEYPDVSENRGR